MDSHASSQSVDVIIAGALWQVQVLRLQSIL